MVVGVLHVECGLPGTRSIKDKRRVVKSLLDRLHHRYRVAARTGNTPESSSGNCGFRTVALP